MAMIFSLKDFVNAAAPDQYGQRRLELATWNGHDWKQAHGILTDLADLTSMYSLNFHVLRSGVFTLLPQSSHEVRDASWRVDVGNEGIQVGRLWLSTKEISFITVETEDPSDAISIKLEYEDDIEVELQLSSRYGQVEAAQEYWGDLVPQAR